MKEYKLALALDGRTLNELLDKGFHDFFRERERKGMFRMVNTPDEQYKVFLWDWETPDPDKWEDLLRHLEHRRHALIQISEEGEIWKDIETDDEFGCDGVFEEIFGWTASICLWQDASQIIV